MSLKVKLIIPFIYPKKDALFKFINLFYRLSSLTGLLLILILTFINFGFTVDVSRQRWGLGVIIGEPNGMSLKYWANRKIALSSAFAWSVGQKNMLYTHADYLIHNYKIFEVKDFTGSLPLYYGIGIQLTAADLQKNVLGVRLPVGGVEYMFSEIPFEVFVELVPTFLLYPATNIYLGAGMGIRFYF